MGGSRRTDGLDRSCEVQLTDPDSWLEIYRILTTPQPIDTAEAL